MPSAMFEIGVYGYTAEAAVFVVVCALSLAARLWRLPNFLLLFACLASAAWAGTVAYGYQIGVSFGLWERALDLLRQSLWIAVLWVLLHPELIQPRDATLRRGLLLRTAALFALWLFLAIIELRWVIGGPQTKLLTQLILVTVGLVLIENLLRRASSDTLWSLKFLCIGLGGIFAYDLFLTAEGFLSQGIDPGLDAARGVVHALAAALIGISVRRVGHSEARLTLQRSTAFYTATLTVAGAYLCLMAFATIIVGRFGGATAMMFQAILLFSAAALLVVILASGRFRAHVRNIVNRNFFKYKYDYRREWLRFTETLSEDDPSIPLETRIVRAVAQILDSPAGAMWLNQDGQLTLVSAWNLSSESLSAAEAAPIAAHLEQTQLVIDMSARAADATAYEGVTLPATLARIERAWAIVPLIHHDTLVGLVLLTRARAPRDLDLEDIDLLKTLGRHAASYIAEQQAGRALAEAREFEKLNRRFAFALHDIKNLASQFSLVAANFENHGDNPAFRQDMVATLKDTSAEMKRLMQRLQGDPVAETDRAPVSLGPLLQKLCSSERRVSIEANADDDNTNAFPVLADHDRLVAVFRHLIDNAIEAIDENGCVRVSLRADKSTALVEIIDDGVGMDLEFINNELFRPFRTTKKSGFGLGAFQCRDYVRELGGDIDVLSTVGTGTTVRVNLPLSEFIAVGFAASE